MITTHGALNRRPLQGARNEHWRSIQQRRKFYEEHRTFKKDLDVLMVMLVQFVTRKSS